MGTPKTPQHRQRISESHPGHVGDEFSRVCTECQERKPLDEFPPAARGLHNRRWSCKECYRAKARAWGNATYQRHRKAVIAMLGSRCSRCGIDDERVLAIDHVNGGGRQHRKKASGAQLLRNIIRELLDGSLDYRLLCHNCNWIVYVAEA